MKPITYYKTIVPILTVDGYVYEFVEGSKVRALEEKLAVLSQWREEALRVNAWWMQVDAAVRKHPSTKLGEVVALAALRIVQESAHRQPSPAHRSG